MWYLVETSPPPTGLPAPKYWLGGTHSGSRIIGRKNVHIRIKATSVSRTHATIRVIASPHYSLSENPVRQRSTAVVLEDSSAYGTYIKYPVGHPSNRFGETEGHHRRLDKNSPTNVQEGALLAFGAPTSWWRLGWFEIVCFPCGLLARQQERLQEVTKNAGLEVVDTFSTSVTHFITGECKTSSMKFLLALARGVFVVTPAWAQSVQHTVKEACKEITEATSDVAAVSASKLAPETLFSPPFHSSDVSAIPADILKQTFSSSSERGRLSLLKSMVFAFFREDRRSKWAPVLEALGADAIHVRAMKGHPQEAKIVVVSPEPVKTKRYSEFGDCQEPPLQDSKLSIVESALVKAILTGDISHTVQEKTKTAIECSAEVGVHLDDVKARKNVLQGEGSTARKARNLKPCNMDREESETKNIQVRDTSHVSVDVHESELGQRASSVHYSGLETDNADGDQNVRKFFRVSSVEPSLPIGNRTKNSEEDVRRFRRKRLPRVAKIPLKRTKYMEDESKFPHRSYDRAASKGSGGGDESS